MTLVHVKINLRRIWFDMEPTSNRNHHGGVVALCHEWAKEIPSIPERNHRVLDADQCADLQKAML